MLLDVIIDQQLFAVGDTGLYPGRAFLVVTKDYCFEFACPRMQPEKGAD